MRVIESKFAPKPVGPYSQANMVGHTIYVSGQIALDRETGAMVQSSVAAETEKIMDNIEAILLEASYQMKDIAKTTIYVTDINYFDEVNAVYAKYFMFEPPARSFVQVVALPKGARVEIEAIARK